MTLKEEIFAARQALCVAGLQLQAAALRLSQLRYDCSKIEQRQCHELLNQMTAVLSHHVEVLRPVLAELERREQAAPAKIAPEFQESMEHH